MIKTLQQPGLGAKLSLLTGTNVALLFLLFTFALSHRASNELEALALEDLHNQVSGVSDMVQMFDSSLSEEVESYTRLFSSFLPQPLVRDESQPQTINGMSVPLLKGGAVSLHENNAIPDDFLQRTAAISTLFVRSGDDFVRVATSLRKEDGNRAIGTVLDRSSPAWQKASRGEIYRGLALLFGKRYITQYQPVKDNAGNTVAILFVGVDISVSWRVMREKILSRRLGSSGHVYVLDGAAGKITATISSTAATKASVPTGMRLRCKKSSTPRPARWSAARQTEAPLLLPIAACRAGTGPSLARWINRRCSAQSRRCAISFWRWGWPLRSPLRYFSCWSFAAG